MKLIKAIILYPSLLILLIYFYVQYLKNEYFNENIIEHELNKVYGGDEYFVNSIIDKIRYVKENYTIHLYTISLICWGIKFYNYFKH